MLLWTTGFAQKQNFDITTYLAPDGWAEQKTAGHVSYSRIENGNWAQITVYKSTVSSGNTDTDFDNDWNELVAVNKNITAPVKTAKKTADGWTVMSGTGTWEYNGAKVTSCLTVYSDQQVSVSLVCNYTHQPYYKDYQALLASLSINGEGAQQGAGAKNKSTKSDSTAVTATNSVTGIWVVNEAETRGFTNGHLMYSGGYMRKEYQFKDDGTYIFRQKDWLANNEAIYFVYESGTWKTNGNRLTLSPVKGKAGWWYKDKVTNDVNKWGKYQKAAPYKTQKVDYTFEIKADDGYGSVVILHSSQATERDGGRFNDPPYRFAYVQRKEALIDNPPGFTF